jgi:hypothetical protein
MSVTFSGRASSGRSSRRHSSPPQASARQPSARQQTSPGEGARQQTRRVREEVRDGLAVAAFSAAASTVLAVTLTLLSHLVA